MALQRFYTKKETAEVLGVCTRTIERYIAAGKLKGAKFGKAWKFSDDDIQALYDTVKEESTKALQERKK